MEARRVAPTPHENLRPVLNRIDDLRKQFESEGRTFEDVARVVAYLQSLRALLDASLTKAETIFGEKSTHDRVLSLIIRRQFDDSFVEACDQHLTVVNQWLEKAAPDAAQSFRELHAMAEELFAKLFEKRMEGTELPVLQRSQFIEVKTQPPEEQVGKVPGKVAKALDLEFCEETGMASLFVPDEGVLKYIEERLDLANAKESLQTIFGEAARTYREYSIYVIEQHNLMSLAKDYVSFPRLDLVREISRYQSYMKLIAKHAPVVRKETAALKEEMAKLFAELDTINKFFADSYYFSKVNMAKLLELTKENSLVFLQKERLTFLKSIFDRCPVLKDVIGLQWFGCHYLTFIFSKYFEISQTLNFETIGQLIKEMIDATTTAAESLENEMNETRTYKKTIEAAMAEWKNKPRVQVTDDNGPQLPGLRQKSVKLGQEALQAEKDFTVAVVGAAERHNRLAKAIENTELFPVQVDKLIDTITQSFSEWMWAKKRLESQIAEEEAHAAAIHKMQAANATMSEEIKIKREKLDALCDEHLKEPQKKPNRRLMRLCPQCCKRPRDSIISACGHTFCQQCLSGKTSCPCCSAAFGETDVHKINWN